MSFLEKHYGFEIVDSRSEGMGAMVVLESSPLRIMLVRDRSQILFSCQSNSRPQNDGWWSNDLIYQFLTGEICDAVMNVHKARFLESQFGEVIDAFYPEKLVDTETTFHRLIDEHAKRLWGH